MTDIAILHPLFLINRRKTVIGERIRGNTHEKEMTAKELAEEPM
jgi:hypothetical protein